MNETKRLRKGQARLEFIACRERTKELLEKGYDLRAAYNLLFEEGVITMSYSGFWENFTQRRRRKKEGKTAQAQPHQVTTTPAVSKAPAAPLKPHSPAPAVRSSSGQSEFDRKLQAKVLEAERVLTEVPAAEQSEFEKAKKEMI